jgi:hypothetical protein
VVEKLAVVCSVPPANVSGTFGAPRLPSAEIDSAPLPMIQGMETGALPVSVQVLGPVLTKLLNH